MKKQIQTWSILFLILFIFPILMNFLPNENRTASAKKIGEPLRIVYASNIFEAEIEEPTIKKVLLYYTHNEEAYEPITEEKNGKIAVSHRTENIMKFGEKLKNVLSHLNVETNILQVNNSEELKKKGLSFSKSYHSIRPFVQQEINEEMYDLIIDLHRDSVNREKTTVHTNGNDYARVAFVVGLEHQNYKENEAKAIALKREMEKLVPGITRNIIRKSGVGVDGIYNQDLNENIILVELGGKENKEAELNNTITILGQAIDNLFRLETIDEN